VQRIVVPADTRLYLFSDGAYEVQRPDGTMMRFDELLALISAPAAGESDLDLVFRYLQRTRGNAALDDDFSIVRFML
jgi:serine phosphatase RsbU (regulator of sigma subunit)